MQDLAELQKVGLGPPFEVHVADIPSLPGHRAWCHWQRCWGCLDPTVQVPAKDAEEHCMCYNLRHTRAYLSELLPFSLTSWLGWILLTIFRQHGCFQQFLAQCGQPEGGKAQHKKPKSKAVSPDFPSSMKPRELLFLRLWVLIFSTSTDHAKTKQTKQNCGVYCSLAGFQTWCKNSNTTQNNLQSRKITCNPACQSQVCHRKDSKLL